MRVGFLTYGIRDPHKLAGIARYTVELTRALQRLETDLEIVLLTPYPESAIPWYREFETFALPSLKLLPAVATLGHLTLHRAAQVLRLDVLHDPCGIAPFAAPRSRYRRVVTIHDSFARVVPETQDPMMRLLYRTLVPLTRYTADAVLTVSQASAQDLTRYCHIPPHKLHVTPLGIPARAKAPEESGPRQSLRELGVTRPYFLFVGNLTPRKNLGRVLEAFARVRKSCGDVQLVVVGPTFWRSEEIFRQAQQTQGVLLTGFVSDETLHELYGGAAGLVFPSLYEGFGLPALEAMSRNCPVITSNVSSLPEVVGDAALLVNPQQVDEIAAAMCQLLRDSELSSTLRRRGRRQAASFSWDRTARQTLDVYRSLLA